MSWFKKILSRPNPPAQEEHQAVSEDSQGRPLMGEPVKTEGLQTGLQKTRHFWGESLGRLLFGKKQLSPELLEELETCLLSADIGIETTSLLITPLTQSLQRNELQDSERVVEVLKQQLEEQLTPLCQPLVFPSSEQPMLILVVGVNGAGKTTTMAKLARRWQLEGKKVMMAAGDTFRAAAVEQLQHWGARFDIPVVAQGIGADSAAVIYDAWQSAKAKSMDVLIADTAGRLHTQSHLMDELKKIKRVLTKIDASLPHETMLVIDAGIGQNALNQVRQFHEAIGVTGLSITKLDGTAKGGMVFALSQAFAIPFRYIGVGEAVEDLRPFEAHAFVEAIFNDDSI